MDDRAALKVAIELMRVPWRVRALRSEPLPDDLVALLEIAAGNQQALRDAASRIDRSEPTVRQAAAFFIEQILLAPEADSYRVLGARPDATTGELRRNMALLLKGLHPDVARQGGQSLFAGRVIAAWDDLKSPERRAAYDAARSGQSSSASPVNGSQGAAHPGSRGLLSKAKGKRAPQRAPHALFPRRRTRLDFYSSERDGLLRRAFLCLFRGHR